MKVNGNKEKKVDMEKFIIMVGLNFREFSLRD